MVGKVTSEGDRALKSDFARQLFNVDGKGIKVGIISKSFDAQKKATDDIASSDLPGSENPEGRTQPVRILKDFTNTNSSFADDEGRALLQIVHDVAPGAELLFHTVVEGESGTKLSDVNSQSYATAVKNLADAGADVIVDDAVFPTTVFQDGIAAKAVNDAVDRGVAVISASGNNGNRSYESQFRPSTTFFFEGNTYNENAYLVIGKKQNLGDTTPKTIKWISLANGLDRKSVYQYVNDNRDASANSTVYGQPNATEAIAVGAGDYRKTPAYGVNSPELRDYASRGGVPIFFDERGERLFTPEVRSKPDIVAPDEVSTTFDSSTDFNPFSGTSAAAPHIAGVAALILEKAGGKENLTPEQISAILQKSSIPVKPESGLPDKLGFAQADAAVKDSLLNKTEEDLLVGGKGKDVLLNENEKSLLIANEYKDSFELDRSGIYTSDVFRDEHNKLDTHNLATLPEIGIGEEGNYMLTEKKNNDSIEPPQLSNNISSYAEYAFS
jgi:subtilisin family serine protease